MDGFRSHSRDAQAWRYQRTGNRAVSLELRGFGRRPLKHGSRLPVWRPVQTGSSLPDRELNAASGGDNEKTAKKRPPLSKGGQKSFMTYHWH